MVKNTGPYCHLVLQWEEGEDDYSTELGKDGSLVLVSVELKHAGTYTFTVSNRVGSVEGCTKLVVHWFVYSVPSQSQLPTQDQYIRVHP